MDVTTLSITLSVVLGVICTPCGLFLGLVSMKAGLVAAKQSKASQMVSFIVAIVFIGLLVARHDLETWAMVIGLVIGFAVASPRTARLGFAQVAVLQAQAAPLPERVKKAKKK